MAQQVITAVGPDRPGIVDRLTGRLLDAGANIADARMVNLRGQFAVILLVEAPGDLHVDDIGAELGLTITVGRSGGGAAARTGVPYRLRTYAMDQPGLVHRITHVLHLHQVNIEELETRLEAGSYTGTPLFTMELTMTVPTSVAIKTLRDELETLCDSLNCDLDLDPA